MLSPRYIFPTIILLALALIPTTIHSYLGLATNDGKSVKSINTELDHYASKPTTRNPGWGEETFESFDWIERNYRDQKGNAVRFFAARSYQHKRLYHHPELALSYGRNLRRQGKEYLATDETAIPISYFKEANGTQFVAYALLYDNKFIENPIVHQLTDSLNLLVSAKKPMTLFYVSQSTYDQDLEIGQLPAMFILKAAIESFQASESKNKS